MKKSFKPFILSLCLSLPIFILDNFIAQFRYSRGIQFLLSIPVIVYCARWFFIDAIGGLKKSSLKDSLPISVGIGWLYLYSVIAYIFKSPYLYFDISTAKEYPRLRMYFLKKGDGLRALRKSMYYLWVHRSRTVWTTR